MSEKLSAAAAAAASVRAAMLDPSKLAGPRQTKTPLPFVQRLAGGEMQSWCVTTDLQAVLTPLLSHPISPPCQRAVERAIVAVSIVTIARAERVLRREALRRDLPPGVCPVLRAAADVLPFHMAELGCRVSAARIASMALANAHLAVQTGRLDRAFLLFRHALFRAEEADHGRGEDAELAQGPLYQFLEAFDERAGLWLQTMTAFESADRMVEDEHDILRGGVGMVAPPPSDLAVLDLILGQAREAKVAAASGRTLVVFPTMGHLPTPSKSTSDRGDSPRAIAEPWAGKGMPLTPAPDPSPFAARLRALFPWAESVIETFAGDLVGAPYAAVRPRILLGPPGCGKTAFARAVLEAAELDVTVYGCAGQMDGGAFAGTSRQWGSWRPSTPAQGCLRHGKASHGIVVDEVEKAGDSRRWGRLDETILPFLERGSTARAIHDPAFETALDLSAVSYVLTANSLGGVSTALLDRCQVLTWPAPRAEDLPVVAAGILAEIRRDRGLDTAWCPDLDGEEMGMIPWVGGSMRPLRRMVEAVVASRELEARRRPN
ncbi:AAA family ATPase [Methylobacterium sp. SD274]|uniref:ATPase family associated with various cellular activities (AAA) n=1 Tax=Methylobacterium gossipiicola TaxID=582675 RepID=A0A1I2UZM9_9HYPH|nr:MULTISPECIES: AAA family ATPase [Methylobacterium]MBO1022075.1 AAA family ATPase [Methylobacterium sp. SD274]SFG82390.1 ATPase family associated with various cellular activities (AAA) [Methylobacterium gossipiicola]